MTLPADVARCHGVQDEAKRIAAVLRTLAESAEPVAWIYEFYADMGHKGLAFEEQPSAHNTPLYTAPTPRTPLRRVTYVCPVCAASLERQE